MSNKQQRPSLKSRVQAWTGGGALAAWLLFAALALLPLVLVPSWADAQGPIKVMLLSSLMVVALFAFVLHVYQQRSIARRAHWTWVVPLLLVALVAASAIGSSAGFSAWIGSGGQGYTAVFPMLATVIAYVLALAAGQSPRFLRFGTLAVVSGAVLAGLWAALEYTGIPLSGPQHFAGFSPSGTWTGLLVLLSLAASWSVGLWLASDASVTDTWVPTPLWRRVWGVFGVLATVLAVAGILLVDSWVGALTLLVGIGTLVALCLFDPKRFTATKRLIVPMALFALALIVFILPLPWTSKVPREAQISYTHAAHIAQETLKVDGPFGSGPATYTESYTRFKAEGVNTTPFWQVLFDRSPSHILTLFTTWGLVPTLVYLGFVVFVLVRVGHALILRREREDWQAIAVLTSGWLALLIAQGVYASDATLQVVFWVATGLLVARVSPAVRLTLPAHGRGALLSSGAIVVVGVAGAVYLFTAGQWLIGETLIARAVQVQQEDGSKADLLELVGGAAKRNQWHAGYTRALVQAHLQQVQALAGQEDVEAEIIGHSVDSAMALARKSVELNPVDVRNARLAASTFGALSTVVAGADIQSVDYHRYAVQLDPANPLQRTALAQALMRAADGAMAVLPEGDERTQTVTQLLEEARAQADASIALRQTAEGVYIRALILERLGYLDQAIQELEALIVRTPQDPVLRFELGVLQLRSGNKERALLAMESALERAPTYANAKWYLAAIYEDLGNLEEAILQLQDLLILDPENTTVQQRLQLLQTQQQDAQDAAQTKPIDTL